MLGETALVSEMCESSLTAAGWELSTKPVNEKLSCLRVRLSSIVTPTLGSSCTHGVVPLAFCAAISDYAVFVVKTFIVENIETTSLKIFIH